MMNVLADDQDVVVSSVVLQRMTDAAGAPPPTAFLSLDLLFLDENDSPIAADGFTTSAAFDASALGAGSEDDLLEQTEQAVRNSEPAVPIAIQHQRIEPASWTFQGETVGDYQLMMVGHVTLRSSLLSVGGVPEGLVFRARSAELLGGISLDLTTLPPDLDAIDGLVKGTIKAGPERTFPPVP
jgi:hypothetical protein